MDRPSPALLDQAFAGWRSVETSLIVGFELKHLLGDQHILRSPDRRAKTGYGTVGTKSGLTRTGVF